MTDFTVVIPARFASSRFPGKPLALIQGKPMIQHVYERALEAGARQVIVATDDASIEQSAQGFGADVCMTSSDHDSGTTRIAEVIELRKIDNQEIVINVQGDEPFIPPTNIRQVADNLAQFTHYPMATLCFPITLPEDVLNPNIVKVVKDEHNKALYFSRAPIPYPRADMKVSESHGLTLEKLSYDYFRHIGIYGYRAEFVTKFGQMRSSALEYCESLEQLRVLEHGYSIHVAQAVDAPPHGVDTPEDLAKLNAQ
jgi:3-deoxy-manno-octulosonate cytidylyltransferase (CMP-KDO synthetase)